MFICSSFSSTKFCKRDMCCRLITVIMCLHNVDWKGEFYKVDRHRQKLKENVIVNFMYVCMYVYIFHFGLDLKSTPYEMK